MAGAIPYPAFAPTVTIPGAAGHSSMYDQPTRGGLAENGEWLQALRHRVADQQSVHESGGEVWAPPSAGDVRVLFAGDVGSYRVALVEGNWRWGPIASPEQVWYFGRSGAPAEKMEKGGNGEPEEINSTTVTPGNLGDPGSDPSADAAAVVVSARPVDVRVATAPDIAADARVTLHETRQTAQPDGTYAIALPAPQSYTLLINGRNRDGTIRTADTGISEDTAGQQSWSPLRGGPELQSSIFGNYADFARGATRQPVGSGEFRLLAAVAPTNAPRVVAGILTLPSGAQVLTGGAILNESDSGGTYGTDSAVLVPAGPISDLAFAWRSTPAEFGDRPDWTAAVGPKGTASVQWVHADGSVTSSAADHTMATVPRDDVVTVRFLDKDGDRIATRMVLAPLPPDDQVLPAVSGQKP